MARQTPLVRVGLVTEEISESRLRREVAAAGAGAVLSFIGTVRNHKSGREVQRIDYEAYAPMAEKVLQRIAGEASRRWPLEAVVIVHRLGRVEIMEASVAIFLSTPHRAEGFEALRFCIEEIKRDVPIWKKEHFVDGEVWVQEGS